MMRTATCYPTNPKPGHGHIGSMEIRLDNETSRWLTTWLVNRNAERQTDHDTEEDAIAYAAELGFDHVERE